jgi:DNA-binding CsgD family transcriptional regulator/PAS domain-containing protein
MCAVRTESFERVTQRFYEAAALPELWPDALHALSRACDAEGTAAHSSDGLITAHTVVSDGAAGLYDEFVAHWRAPELNTHRARGLALIQRGWSGALTEQDCFTPEELAHDPFQQEFIVPNGFSSFAGLVLARAPGLMMSASIYRRPEQGPYFRDEIALINQLTEHLRAACEIAMRLGIQSTQRMADAFAVAGYPIALIGRDGSILHANARFERLIGEDLYVKEGRLGSWESPANEGLAAAIHRAIRHDGEMRRPFSSIVLPRRNALRPLVAQVAPVVGQARDILHRVTAIVTLVDVEAANTPPAASLTMQVFGLTPAEARLAGLIASGKSLSEIASIERTTYQTLRTRLKSVFEKTGTRRQVDLVLLLGKLTRQPDD